MMPSVQVTGFDNINASLRQIIVAINNLTAALGNAFPVLSSSEVWDPPSVSSGAQTTTTITVTGAAVGAPATASFSLSLSGLTLSAYVSATNTVTVVLSNLTGAPVDLSSGTLSVRVFG